MNKATFSTGKRKVAVIGVGYVGASIAYALTVRNIAREIVLIDRDASIAQGEALDICHGVPFMGTSQVYAGDYADCADCDLVIICAGRNRRLGETRRDLVDQNVDIMRSVIDALKPHYTHGAILIVTNPVDILTYVTYKLSGLPKQQIIGSGTVLDTSRLKYLISKHTGIDARYCHTYIIGEHGDSEVAAWSITNIAGMSMKSFFEHDGKCTDEDLQAMYSEVKNSAYEIIQKKGATYYAIATAVARIVECISGGENSVLTISSVLNGEYGIEDISLSVPTQVSGYGVERILDVPFNETELQGLRSSAKTLKDSLKSIGF